MCMCTTFSSCSVYERSAQLFFVWCLLFVSRSRCKRERKKSSLNYICDGYVNLFQSQDFRTFEHFGHQMNEAQHSRDRHRFAQKERSFDSSVVTVSFKNIKIHSLLVNSASEKLWYLVVHMPSIYCRSLQDARARARDLYTSTRHIFTNLNFFAFRNWTRNSTCCRNTDRSRRPYETPFTIQIPT